MNGPASKIIARNENLNLFGHISARRFRPSCGRQCLFVNCLDVLCSSLSVSRSPFLVEYWSQLPAYPSTEKRWVLTLHLSSAQVLQVVVCAPKPTHGQKATLAQRPAQAVLPTPVQKLTHVPRQARAALSNPRQLLACAQRQNHAAVANHAQRPAYAASTSHMGDRGARPKLRRRDQAVQPA